MKICKGKKYSGLKEGGDIKKSRPKVSLLDGIDVNEWFIVYRKVFFALHFYGLSHGLSDLFGGEPEELIHWEKIHKGIIPGESSFLHDISDALVFSTKGFAFDM